MNYQKLRLLILMMLIAIALMLIFGCAGYYYDREPTLIATAKRITALAANPQNKAPPRIRPVFIRPDNRREVAIFYAGVERGKQECMNEREKQ